MLLEKNNYSREALLNKTVLITGGGGGIGVEASRAFSYMGANVIVAEINTEKGRQTQRLVNEEYGNENVDFYQIDISDEKQID
jgi:NAD(P)-dependent dehydrogenase (short-subunit alcohol dehydrogenase family)